MAVSLRHRRSAYLDLHLSAETFAVVNLLRPGLLRFSLRGHDHFSSEILPWFLAGARNSRYDRLTGTIDLDAAQPCPRDSFAVLCMTVLWTRLPQRV
jgi:hypothetical protein